MLHDTWLLSVAQNSLSFVKLKFETRKLRAHFGCVPAGHAGLEYLVTKRKTSRGTVILRDARKWRCGPQVWALESGWQDQGTSAPSCSQPARHSQALFVRGARCDQLTFHSNSKRIFYLVPALWQVLLLMLCMQDWKCVVSVWLWTTSGDKRTQLGPEHWVTC